MKWSDRYEKQNEIGTGSSGKIYKVIRKETKQILAAKIISVQSNASELEAVEQQIKIISSCNHKNIVQCLGIQLYEGEVWILMEFCEGGSLADIIRVKKNTFNEEEICNMLRQVIEGLVYLHSKNIVHRDIKASNLLYQKGVIKIADFGVSIYNKETKTQGKYSRIGSPYWMSPQVLSDSIYNDKTDIWALGITAIELAEGEPPFSHQHPFRAIYSIQTHPPQEFTHPEQWSHNFNSFLKACLNIDYNKRLNAKQLLKQSFIFGTDLSLIQSSPKSCLSNESEDTIIMHDQMPRSMWEKESFPQSQEKIMHQQNSMNNTFVINEDIEESEPIGALVQDKHLTRQNLLIKSSRTEQNYQKMKFEQREAKVKELYMKMESQIRLIRTKYMQQIRKFYLADCQKENNSQNSQPQTLKIKQCTTLAANLSGSSTSMFGKIF